MLAPSPTRHGARLHNFVPRAARAPLGFSFGFSFSILAPNNSLPTFLSFLALTSKLGSLEVSALSYLFYFPALHFFLMLLFHPRTFLLS